jgi:sporulation protein YlmC with PRC-barrel domain
MQQLQRQPQARRGACAPGSCRPQPFAWHERGRARPLQLQPVATASRDAGPGADSSSSGAAAGPTQSRPSPLLPALRPTVYLQFCQVANKQVITRSKGKNLGTVRNFWVDPRSGRVVSFDLDEKKSLTSTRIANIPLTSLRQIGDVVLVNDDDAASQQPYDDRYGFVALIGMGVRTRSGTYLGKVRRPWHACSPRLPCRMLVAWEAPRPEVLTSLLSWDPHSPADRPQPPSSPAPPSPSGRCATSCSAPTRAPSRA